MPRKPKQPIKIEPGLEITVRGLRWNAGWEFDCPTAIISPVLRTHEDGCSLEHAVESLLIDACIDGYLKDHPDDSWANWRGWPIEYLRRKFYRKGVERMVVRARFTLEGGEIAWVEMRSSPEGGDRG